MSQLVYILLRCRLSQERETQTEKMTPTALDYVGLGGLRV